MEAASIPIVYAISMTNVQFGTGYAQSVLSPHGLQRKIPTKIIK